MHLLLKNGQFGEIVHNLLPPAGRRRMDPIEEPVQEISLSSSTWPD
jgi:hypothetical protein